MADWQPLGKHLVRVDEDLVAVAWRGEVELKDVQVLFARYEQVYAEHGRALAMCDMRHSGTPSAAVRRWIADWMMHRRKLDGVAAYGANAVIRAVFIMLMRGAMILGKFNLPFAIFATEAEARAWIGQLRNKLERERERPDRPHL